MKAAQALFYTPTGLRRSWKQLLRIAAHWAAIAVGSAVLGLFCVLLAQAAAQRPAFLLTLPLLLVVVIMLLISPKALLLSILIIRAGANSIFEEARFASIGGLGGLLNLAVIFLAALLISKDSKKVPKAAYLAWLPFVVMQLLGLVHSPDPVAAARLMLGNLSVTALFLVAFCLVTDQLSLDRLLKVVAASSLPVVLVTLVYVANGKTAGALDAVDGEGARFGGPFPHPNILAFYLVLLIATVFYLWKRPHHKMTPLAQIGSALYIIVLVGLLLITKTRSAWIGAALMFGLFGLMFQRRYLIYMLFGFFVMLLIPEVRDRIVGLAQGNEVVQYAQLNSFAWRKVLWQDGLAWMDAQHYITGYGSEGFASNSPLFFTLGGRANWGAHSVLVQMVFELGIFGLLAYAWTFWASWRLIRQAPAQADLMKLVFGGSLWVYFVVSASDNMLAYLVYNWYFWLVMGAACAAAIRWQTQDSGNAKQFVDNQR